MSYWQNEAVPQAILEWLNWLVYIRYIAKTHWAKSQLHFYFLIINKPSLGPILIYQGNLKKLKFGHIKKAKEKTNDSMAPTMKEFNLPEMKDQEDEMSEGMCKYGMLASEAEAFMCVSVISSVAMIVAMCSNNKSLL